MDDKVAWIRNVATDSQIAGILKQRDRLLLKYASAIKVLKEKEKFISLGEYTIDSLGLESLCYFLREKYLDKTVEIFVLT